MNAPAADPRLVFDHCTFGRPALRLSISAWCLAAAIVVFVACPDSGQAEIVSFQSTGMIGSAVGSDWVGNTPFTAIFSYDTSTAPFYNSYDSMTYYFNTVQSFSMAIGSHTFGLKSGLNNSIRIGNDLFSGVLDRFIVDAPLEGSAAAGYEVTGIQLDLYGDPSTWAGTSLPTDAALLQSLADNQGGRTTNVRLFVYPQAGGSAETAYGYLTTVASVPEPSACAMAFAGLACKGYSMFRRRRAR